MVIPEPIQSREILDRHPHKVQLCNTKHAMTRESRNKGLESLTSDAAINNLDSVLKKAELQNETEEAELAIQEPLQIILTEDGRSKQDSE